LARNLLVSKTLSPIAALYGNRFRHSLRTNTTA
jgi:hypothetical protein